MGDRPQRGPDLGAITGRLRDGGGPEVARSPPSVRPPIRPVECPGDPSRRQRRGVHRAAALRLRFQQRRAPLGGHLRRCERRARRRTDAPNQRRRRSRQSAGAQRHRQRRRRRSAGFERALARGRVHRAEVRRQRLHERDPEAPLLDRRGTREGRQRTASPHPGRCARQRWWDSAHAVRVGQRERGRLPQRASRTRRQHDSDRQRREGGRCQPQGSAARDQGAGLLRPVHVRADDLSGAKERDFSGARPHRPRHSPFPPEHARDAHRFGRHPALVRHHPDRALRERPDVERLHARWAHPRHGTARRRRRRRARVDPSPSAHGDVDQAGCARWGECGRPPRPRIDAHHDGGAPSGLAARRARKEALRAARAHRSGRDDRFLLRQHDGDAGGVSILPRPRGARKARQARRAGDRSARRGILAPSAAHSPVPAHDHRRLFGSRLGERVGGGPIA